MDFIDESVRSDLQQYTLAGDSASCSSAAVFGIHGLWRDVN